jgi:hypothetical protein
VENAANQLIEMDNPAVVVSEADRAELRKVYGQATQSLVEATADEAYPGTAVTVSDGMGPQEVRSLATRVKDEAAEILGFKKFVVLFSLMAFIAAHAIGQGAVIWVFISEIFPNRNRAAGQALGSFTHWLFAASITLVFPSAIGAFDAGVLFAFFCAMMCLQLAWVKFMVPETKGVPLEEIQQKLGIR